MNVLFAEALAEAKGTQMGVSRKFRNLVFKRKNPSIERPPPVLDGVMNSTQVELVTGEFFVGTFLFSTGKYKR